MKKTLRIVIVVAVCALAIQSCKSKPSEEDVQGIVDDFLKSIVNEDYEKAKDLGTDDTDGMIEMIKMSSTMIPDSLVDEMNERREAAKKATITMKGATFNDEGTEATVKFTSSESPGKEESIMLKKVDDKWLVDMAGDMPTE